MAHDFPRSLLTATALTVGLSLVLHGYGRSRMFSISVPSQKLDTCASLVFDFAPVPICLLTPPVTTVYKWNDMYTDCHSRAFTPTSALNCAGTPGFRQQVLSPDPTLKQQLPGRILDLAVIFIRTDQVSPSSVLFTRINWPVSCGVIARLEMPTTASCAQSRTAHPESRNPQGVCSMIIEDAWCLLFRSGSVANHRILPYPLITLMGSQVRPPSVLRLIPKVNISCRSLLLLYLIS
jgi:hypothetical protein